MGKAIASSPLSGGFAGSVQRTEEGKTSLREPAQQHCVVRNLFDGGDDASAISRPLRCTFCRVCTRRGLRVASSLRS